MQVMEKYVVVKKPKMGIMGTIRNSLLEMTPANGSAETEDLHKGGWAIPIVIVKNLAFVSLLIALTVTNTLSNMDKKFLSLSGNIKGTQICEAVPNPLSARFTGDRFGKWDSNSKFDPAAGFYVLKFGGSEVDNATYADAMKVFTKGLADLGQKCAKRDLSYTVMALSSWSVYDHEHALQFTTNAEISFILSNFVFVDSALYTPDGKAENSPGAYGGGAMGYNFQLSSDYKYLSVTFPLSYCKPESQVNAITTAILATAFPSTKTLQVLPSQAYMTADSATEGKPWEITIGPKPGGGAGVNGMEVIWDTDDDNTYDPNTVYVLNFCANEVLDAPPSGICSMWERASFTTDSDGTKLYISSSTDSGVVSTIRNDMVIFGPSSTHPIQTIQFTAYSGGNDGKVPGSESSKLTIQSGKVEDGLVFVTTDATPVALDNCNAGSTIDEITAVDGLLTVPGPVAPGKLGAGDSFSKGGVMYRISKCSPNATIDSNSRGPNTCNFNVSLAITAATTFAKPKTVFSASASSSSTTLTVTEVYGSTRLSNNDAFIYGVVAYTVSNCLISGVSASAGISSSDIATSITTGNTASSTTVTNIPDTSSIAVGMSVTGSGVSTTVASIVDEHSITLTAAASTTVTGLTLTFRKVCTCTLSSSLTLASATLSVPSKIFSATASGTTLTIVSGTVAVGDVFVYDSIAYTITAGSSSPFTIDKSLTLSGTTFLGVTGAFTALSSESTLSVLQVVSGTLSSGDVFVYDSGSTDPKARAYPIASCDVSGSTNTSIGTGSLGTCTLLTSLSYAGSVTTKTTCDISSKQSFPPGTSLKGSLTKVKDCTLSAKFEACTTSSTANAGYASNTCLGVGSATANLLINTVSGGKVLDGMVITVGYDTFTLSACTGTLDGTATTSPAGQCTLSSAATVVSGSSFTILGSGQCTIYYGKTNGDTNTNTNTGTVISNMEKTSFIYAGMKVTGSGIPSSTTTGNTASSVAVSNIASTSSIAVGMTVTGNGIPSSTTTGNTASTTTVSAISSTSSIAVGMKVTGSGVPASTTVASIDSGASTITLSQAATATATGVALSFSTTVASINSGASTITLSNAATASATSVALSFSTTVVSVDDVNMQITLSNAATATATGVELEFYPGTAAATGGQTTGTTTTSSMTVSAISSTSFIAVGMTVTGNGISSTTTGTTTASSVTVSAISSTSSIAVGMKVTGNGIPTSTTVASIVSASTITLSQAATATATSVALSFSTTVASIDSASTITLSNAATATATGVTLTFSGSISVKGLKKSDKALRETSIQGTATTPSVQRGNPIDDGFTVFGSGIASTATLSNCKRWAQSTDTTMSSCQLKYQASLSLESKIIIVKDLNGISDYATYIASNPGYVPNLGMKVKCEVPGCGIADGTVIESISGSTFYLSKPAEKTDATVKIIFSGISSYSITKSGVSGTFTTSLPLSFASNPITGVSDCKQVKPGTAGYFDQKYLHPSAMFDYVNRDGANTLRLQFDLQSIATAVAVNFGINTLSSLARVNVSNPQSFDPREYGAFYNDPNFVPMDPIFCIKESTKQAASCLVSIKNTLYYPIALTTDPESGEQCKCTDAGDQTSNIARGTACDVTPRISFALIYYPDDIDDSTKLGKGDGSGNDHLVAFARLMKKKFVDGGGGGLLGNGDQALQDHFAPVVKSIAENDFDEVGHFRGFDNLCRGCSADDDSCQDKADDSGLTDNCGVVLSTFLVTPDQFMSINAVGMQLTALQRPERSYKVEGMSQSKKFFSVACTNSIYVDSAAQSLTAKPPVSLTQPYYKCHATQEASAIAAFGSAAGSAGAISGAVVTLMLIFAMMQINGERKKKGELPVLPPLKKTMKMRDDTKWRVDVLKDAVSRLISMDELKLPDSKKQTLLSEFESNFRDLKNDEDRVPLVRAEAEGLEKVDLDAVPIDPEEKEKDKGGGGGGLLGCFGGKGGKGKDGRMGDYKDVNGAKIAVKEGAEDV